MLCTAWPYYWADKLLLVRGLSSAAKPDDLQPIFSGAADIIISKETEALPRVYKQRMKAAIPRDNEW